MICEEFSKVIQEYVLREMKLVLNRYRSITVDDADKVENLIRNISNSDIKEELFNDWNKTLELAKEVGNIKINDRVISMFQWINKNTDISVSVSDVIRYSDTVEMYGYIVIDDDKVLYKKSTNIEEMAKEILDEMLEDETYVDSLLDKDSLIEYWIRGTSKEAVIRELISGVEIEELLGLDSLLIYENEYEEYMYSEINC